MAKLIDGVMDGLPAERILERYRHAGGNEIESGKFASPESSAALAANAFGIFLMAAPPVFAIPGLRKWGKAISEPLLEAQVRFPWSGGRHPWLDVLVETDRALLGIESKRYEPFRKNERKTFSEAYWRRVWGRRMAGWEGVRNKLRDGELEFQHLDAVQLTKHAFGLRTAVNKAGVRRGKMPVLLYLYAEPPMWPDGTKISREEIERHRKEIATLKKIVKDDEVELASCSYAELLTHWAKAKDERLREHAAAIAGVFDVGAGA